MSWNPANLPNSHGVTYFVTGANSGLGYFASEQLARSGANVILSGRNPERVDRAVAAVKRRVPGASVEPFIVDVSSLDSVAQAAEKLGDRSIDGLMFNAGMVHPPKQREESVDGNELVLATNVLGHFAFGARLFEQLPDHARIVWLGSMVTRLQKSDLTDLQLENGYNQVAAYAQSKIAGEVIGFELDRRLRMAGSEVKSIVAHPGYSLSGRTRGIRGVNEPRKIDRFADNLQAFMAQSKENGAHSQVRAMLDDDIQSGDYVGPKLISRGAPAVQEPTTQVKNLATAARVWAEIADTTGVDWPV